MEKTNIKTEQISSNRTISKTNVTYMIIHNYGDAAMKLILNGVEFVIPAFDEANQYSRNFEFPADSTYSDIEFDVEFVTGKAGKAILMYKDITNPQNC